MSAPAHTFTAAERAWLDAQRAKHAPLSDRQAALVRRVLRPRTDADTEQHRGAA